MVSVSFDHSQNFLVAQSTLCSGRNAPGKCTSVRLNFTGREGRADWNNRIQKRRFRLRLAALEGDSEAGERGKRGLDVLIIVKFSHPVLLRHLSAVTALFNCSRRSHFHVAVLLI